MITHLSIKIPAGCGRKRGRAVNTPDTRPASLFLEGPVRDRDALKKFMDKSASKIYRIKGFLELEGQMRYVSDNSRGFSIVDVKKRISGPV